MEQENDHLSVLYKITPELNCGAMHKYFNVTGLPMFLQPIDGFELPYQNLAEDGIEILSKVTGGDVLGREVEDLIWNAYASARNYRLYQVKDMTYHCSKKSIESLAEHLDYVFDLYETVTINLPVTYLVLMVVFEFYLLFWNDHSIYYCKLVLCYGYVYFMTLSFVWMIKIELQELDTAQWDCIDQKW